MLFRRWFESRSLAVLQVHFAQPLKQPLPPFEKQLLRGAVNLTRKDGGTPFDAAARFYAAYAETAIGNGRKLIDIGFPTVMARTPALKNRMKFHDEHIATLRQLIEMEKERS